MADIIIKVLTPADTYDLLTLDEMKVALGIVSTDTSQDEQLAADITRYSDVIAQLCRRTFAKEEVRETWRCLGSRRTFLSHYPALETDIASVESPRGSVLDPSGYEFEEKSGKLELFATQSEPVVITYTGGYDLPEEAPPALKQVCEIMVMEGRAMRRSFGTSGVKSISHKNARVMFFDPLASSAKALQQFGYSMSSVNSLLSAFMRIEV